MPVAKAPRKSAPSRTSDAIERIKPAAAHNEAAFDSPAVEPKTIVKPVVNAMAILRYLGKGKPRSATQIARDLKINTSTCFNILRTLASERVVSFDDTAKTYKLGIGMLTLMSNVLSEESRLAAAREHLLSFAELQGATVCLWRRVSLDRNTLVASEHGAGNVRIHLQVGQNLPVLLGSTGRVMATRLGLTKAQVRKKFSDLRWFEKPDFEAYWADAVEGAQRGWAVDDGNFSAGILTVSAPIFDSSGNIGYSLTVLTFRELHRFKPLDQLGRDVVKVAATLSEILY